jgi:hypothetical protein
MVKRVDIAIGVKIDVAKCLWAIAAFLTERHG